MSVQSCECLIGRDLVAPRRRTRAKCSVPNLGISLTGCALKDLSERKAKWELDVEPPAVRENSTDRCAGSGADHVAINVFHLAAARHKTARRIDGEHLLQHRKV